MGSDQLCKVPCQGVLVVGEWAHGQWNIETIPVNHDKVFDEDEVKLLADRLVRLSHSFRLLVNPLEVEDSLLDTKLMEHELRSDESNGGLSLVFHLISS